MTGLEFFLWTALAVVFWKKKLHHRFPSMGLYLALHVVSAPVLSILFNIYNQPWGRDFYPAYYFLFFGVYIASAVLLFFVAMEVFRSALSAFSGLVKFGLVIFRWAVIASVLVTLS